MVFQTIEERDTPYDADGDTLSLVDSFSEFSVHVACFKQKSDTNPQICEQICWAYEATKSTI